MENTTTGIPILLAKPAATLFVLVSGIALAFGICFSVQLIPFALGVVCLVLLVALSRLQTTNLLIAFIVADHLCQFLKRAIFLLGPQPMLVYWGFQLLPTLILFLAVASSLYALRTTRFPLSAKLLCLFIAIGLAQTFLSPNGSDLINRFAATNRNIIPLFAAFAGMTLPIGDWRRVAKLFLILIVISSVYGVFQLAHGPTVVDRAWALQTGDYSIEGDDVYRYITGASNDFRAYSYYSDPSTWGFFLIMGTLFIASARHRHLVPKIWLKVGATVAVAGILVTETRTMWVALFGAILVHWVLGSRALRRPMVVITGILVAFGLVLSVGQYAIVHWVPRLTNSALMNRYMTVGTLEARVSALDIFMRALPRHIILGDGYGTSGTALETADQTRLLESEYFSHNAIVGLLLSVGLPGLLAFGFFLYRWLWEILKTMNRSTLESARSQRWIASACVGMLFTGALTGPLFLSSPYFMLFVGIAMGETVRLRQARENERQLLAMEINRLDDMRLASRTVNV